MLSYGSSLVHASCLLAVVALIGCGPPAPPKREFADVSGKVSYKGEALTKGTVAFQPASGIAVVGEIGEDGTYSLKGVIGPNTVTIISRDEGVGPKPDGTAKERVGTPGKSHIPDKYGTPGSGLKFDVEPGANTADFDLQ